MAQESGTLSFVFFYLKTVGANSVHLRHETQNPLQLKSHYQNTATLENKNAPIPIQSTELGRGLRDPGTTPFVPDNGMGIPHV